MSNYKEQSTHLPVQWINPWYAKVHVQMEIWYLGPENTMVISRTTGPNIGLIVLILMCWCLIWACNLKKVNFVKIQWKILRYHLKWFHMKSITTYHQFTTCYSIIYIAFCCFSCVIVGVKMLRFQMTGLWSYLGV